MKLKKLISNIKYHLSDTLRSSESSSFFPNKPQKVMQCLHQLKELTTNYSEDDRVRLYEFLSKQFDEFETTRFEISPDNINIHQANQSLKFPNPIPGIKFSHIMCHYLTWLNHKYHLPGFVEVQQGDIVFDCGGYVGGFSVSIAELASAVYLFEPDAQNYQCCKTNLEQFDNSHVYQLGLYNESTMITFHISSSSVEHSLLQPDDGMILASEKIQVVSLYDFVTQNDIPRIDFLKLEAEGVEPEIYEGLGELRPRKLAIDISPEREGESPEKYFRQVLPAHGYDLQQRGNVLFGRWKT